MSATTQIAVALSNADPTALTALGCLQRSLGFGSRLETVERRVLWELTGPERSDPGELVERLRRGGELWNPNKERARLRRPGEPFETLELPLPGREGWHLYLAWNPERDLDRRPAALGGRTREGWRLARGVLWALRWREGTEEDWLRWSEEAVLCSRPDRGLLVHPHLEDTCRIEPASEPPWLPPAAAGVGRTPGDGREMMREGDG